MAAVVASCRKEMVGFTHGHGQVGAAAAAAAAAALLFWASRHGSKTSGVPVSGSGRIGTMELTLGRRTRREPGSANGQKCSSCQRERDWWGSLFTAYAKGEEHIAEASATAPPPPRAPAPPPAPPPPPTTAANSNQARRHRAADFFSPPPPTGGPTPAGRRRSRAASPSAGRTVAAARPPPPGAPPLLTPAAMELPEPR